MAMPVASSGAPVHRKTQGPLHAEVLCLAGACNPSPRQFRKGLPNLLSSLVLPNKPASHPVRSGGSVSR